MGRIKDLRLSLKLLTRKEKRIFVPSVSLAAQRWASGQGNPGSKELEEPGASAVDFV